MTITSGLLLFSLYLVRKGLQCTIVLVPSTSFSTIFFGHGCLQNAISACHGQFCSQDNTYPVLEEQIEFCFDLANSDRLHMSAKSEEHVGLLYTLQILHFYYTLFTLERKKA